MYGVFNEVRTSSTDTHIKKDDAHNVESISAKQGSNKSTT